MIMMGKIITAVMRYVEAEEFSSWPTVVVAMVAVVVGWKGTVLLTSK